MIHPIDLHAHTTASDGSFSPRELVEHALSLEIKYLGITDHDTFGGVKEALKAAEGSKLRIFPGIEVSAFSEGKNYHILGFMPDTENRRFLEYLESLSRIRAQRNKKILSAMQKDGFTIIELELRKYNSCTMITRSHIARWLVENGHAASKNEAFTKFLLPGCPYYFPKDPIDPFQAVEEITLAGGKAFLAHPVQYRMSPEDLNAFVCKLMDHGLAGLEVFHTDHSPEYEKEMFDLAKRLSLKMSCGSDFHGKNKPTVFLGEGYSKDRELPEEIFETVEFLKKLYR